ncbi:ATX1 Metal homeostasis factor ATX1 [Candida maltosa Xu316]
MSQDLKNYHFDVTMSCSGCSGAVERVLKKLDGVSSYDVSLEKQSVDITTTQSYDTVYNTIAKTGKKINGGKEVTA